MDQMKIGIGKACITPDIGVELAGYGYFLERRNTGALMDLWIRGLALEQNGRRLAILVSDLVGIAQPIVDRAVELISTRCGLPQDAVIIVTTHTHTGPAVSNLCGAGEVDPAYYAGLAAQFALAAERAFSDLAPVSGLETAQVPLADSFAHNRVFPDGSIDSTVRFLRIERAGARSAMLINYSCHPVSYEAGSAASPDYPGILCSLLEQEGVDGIFLNGFCGNINPLHKGKDGCAQQAADMLLDAYRRGLESMQPLPVADFALCGGFAPIALCKLTGEDLEQYYQSMDEKLRNGPMGRSTAIWVYLQKKKLLSEEPDRDWVEYRALRLGELLIVFHSCEVAVEFGSMLAEAFPQARLLFVGTCFSTTRYIATRHMIEYSQAHGNCGYEAFSSNIGYSRLPIACGAGEDHFTHIIGEIRRELYA